MPDDHYFSQAERLLTPQQVPKGFSSLPERPSIPTETLPADRAAGAFAAIRHAGAEASSQRSAHIAQLILDGLRPRPA